MPKKSNHRGFVLIDVVIALAIVGGLAITLNAAVHREQTAEAALGDSRAAIHLAEHTLLNLQHGQPMPSITNQINLQVSPVTGGDVPAGYVWAQVMATVRGHEQSLVGIIPVTAVPPREGTRR